MPSHLVFVFLDGLGLGPPGAHNPFSRLALPAFERLGGGAWTSELPQRDEPTRVVRYLDANLGIGGLPQSGTGQATLFSGTNCAALAGRHFGPYPHSTSKPVLTRRNLFHLAPGSTCFANAYPPRFFDFAESRNRWTVTTFCARAAGLRLHSTDDVRDGHALPAELTGAAWRERLGIDVPLHAEHEAARVLTDLAAQHRLTLFEYYLTDKAGHSRDPDRAEETLLSLDAFFAGLLDALDPTRHLLLVTSDHGNLEDLGVKTHTRNPVPLVALGAGASHFAGATSLLDVVPCIERALA